MENDFFIALNRSFGIFHHNSEHLFRLSFKRGTDVSEHTGISAAYDCGDRVSKEKHGGALFTLEKTALPFFLRTAEKRPVRTAIPVVGDGL